MIQYRDISYKDIELIKVLWERNRQYHEETSEFFGEAYKGLEFEDRIKGFGDFDSEYIKITLAENDKVVVGYCLSVIENHDGEVATLHVLEEMRGRGIGVCLMQSHLQWLKESGCSDIKVVVSQENDHTIEFYRKLGFYPSTIQMHMK